MGVAATLPELSEWTLTYLHWHTCTRRLLFNLLSEFLYFNERNVPIYAVCNNKKCSLL